MIRSVLNSEAKKGIIFDLDDTLSNTKQRAHYLEQTPRDWDSFYEACHLDMPKEDIIQELLENYQKGHEIIIFTGRSKVVEKKTKSRLKKYSIPYHILKMRPKNNFGKGYALKEQWFKKLKNTEIVKAYDDNNETLEMFSKYNIDTVLVERH